MSFHIVLFEPEIPQNTGNISRTCSITNSKLHIIRPMGFSVNDRYLKRAGLDYWKYLDLHYYENLSDFFEQNKGGSFYFCSTKAPHCYTDVAFQENDYLIFGKETAGLPENLLKDHLDRCIRIPMQEQTRSLNLSNSVAIILYEALRQTGFASLQQTSSYLGGAHE